MNTHPRVAYDPAGALASDVRLWLLQAGAQPIDRGEPVASRCPDAPQHAEVTRAEVHAFVHGLKGIDRTPAQRFDDHGSQQSWPRGSY